ncbi:MAG: hypothetical protein D6798_06710 [Deltaproteobacteria bacterium]|nr:MAG: hypothetical protein D6798_06710 [Deltaproteobacteria bacterium]
MIRAALIAGVLWVHGTLAAPWPDLDGGDLRYDLADEELQRWAATLSAVGIDTTPRRLADRLVAVGRWSRRTQRALHRPFRPLLRLTGTGQAWGLFAFPDPHPGRLTVRARPAKSPAGDAAPWRVLYRAPGAGEAWLVDLLENRKVRGIYDDTGDRPRAGFLWNRLCDEVARRIFARWPDLSVVELRFEVMHVTPPPAAGRNEVVGVRHRRLRRRSALLGDAPRGAGTGEAGGAP